MQKKHTPDILSGRTNSRFMAIVDNGRPGSLDCLWNCLIRQECSQHPSLIVSSECSGYGNPLSNQTVVLSANKHDCTKELIRHVLQIANDLHSRYNQRPIQIYVDCFSWMLLDCPETMEFEFWARQLVSLLLDIAYQDFVTRLVIAYRPIRDRKGTLLSSSDNVLSLLSQCVTTLVTLEHPTVLSHPSGSTKVNRVCQQITMCHRRTKQTEFPAVPATTPTGIKCKPALFECLTVEMDPVQWSFTRFTEFPTSDSTIAPVTMEPRLPQSTFDLTLSESEKVAKSKLILPYEAATVAVVDNKTDMNTDVPQSSVGMAIHYQPDCFDDLDDEDPDDDLDI